MTCRLVRHGHIDARRKGRDAGPRVKALELAYLQHIQFILRRRHGRPTLQQQLATRRRQRAHVAPASASAAAIIARRRRLKELRERTLGCGVAVDEAACRLESRPNLRREKRLRQRA